MKSSFIAFVSLFFFLIGTVVAAPTTLDSSEIVKREDFDDVDVLLNNAYTSIVATNANYNATNTVSGTTVTAYCNNIITIITTIIDGCGHIPSGHQFPDITIIADLLFKILCEINFTLKLLLSKCGLLTGLIVFILLLVGGLITALNQLLIVVAGVCVSGLLQLLLSILLGQCGSGFLLLVLGLIIV